MKITEKQLRKIIRESLMQIYEESLNEDFRFLGRGYSLDNRLKNGHWHTESSDNNLVVAAAYKLGWNLEKETDKFHTFSFLKNKEEEQEHSKIEGVYSAEIMDGYGNNVTPDKDITGIEHPKAMWGILIRELNRILMPKGYLATGTNNRRERVDLMGKPTNDDSGAETERGTIIVRKIK